MTGPVPDGVTGSVSDPVAGLVSDPVAGLVSDPVAGPVSDAMAGPVSGPVAGPVSGPATEPLTPGPPGPVTELAVTPSQTVGPFFAVGLPWPDGPDVVPPGTDGAIVIAGRVLDGAGEPVPDALVETWQAGPDGSFAHPDDPRPAAHGAAAFRGFGRCATGPGGEYRIVTLRPGPLPGGDGRTEAPHLDVSLFARGLLDRLVTRIYFPDEEQANASDPALSTLPEPDRRGTLIAAPDGPGRFRFDIRLQGEGETVFFDV